MANDILKNISLETLKRATEIRQQISNLEDELESLLTGGGEARPAKKKARKKKRSAKRKGGARKKKATAENTGDGRRKKKAAAKKKGGKRKLSPEALERIREAQRKRWARVRAEKAGA